MVFDRAHEYRLTVSGVKQRLGQKRGRGFSVGAGDAGGGEAALGMAEEGRGGRGEGTAAVLDFEDGNLGVIDGEVIEGGGGVRDDAGSACASARRPCSTSSIGSPARYTSR
jgi:hypothetical protein